MSKQIGFIGLGNMGLPMAVNLVEAGYKLLVFTRTRSKAESVLAKGASWVSSPFETAVPGGIVITMLPDDEAVEEVAGERSELVKRLGKGGIHLSMSTILPSTARRLSGAYDSLGAYYVASPVFGRPEAAATKKLWICLSGSAIAKDRVAPILGALGQKVFDFGEDPGAANVVKVSGNFLIASALEAMAEAFTLAEKNGLRRTDVADFFGQTILSCGIYQNYGKTIAEKRYLPTGFRLALGFKDVNLTHQLATESRVPMPLTDLLRGRLLSGLAKGRESMDWSALSLGVSEDAGLN